ncbi:MAG TPA: tetratricopeptide repeat protein, partial [Planctomycetaceae bacterium]
TGNAAYSPSAAPNAGASANPPAAMSAPASIAQPQAAIGMARTTREFAEKGEAAFKSGDYAGAVYAWRHAALDDPQNGLVTLLLGQALFAMGKYDEAAGAIQAGMHHLPKDQWGVVVGHYTELYGKTHDYTDQLRALEKAMQAKSEDPALRFLTGYQYAYLGFTERAIEQLDHAVKLAPRDEMSKQLRDTLRAKTAKPAAGPPLPGIPAGPALRPTPQEPDADADTDEK